SRKEKRKLKKRQSQPEPTPAADSTTVEKSKPSTPPNNPPKQRKPPTPDTLLPRSLKDPMPPTKYYPLLVCSIGNPGAQYAKTLHSAGHSILQTIQERGVYQPFTRGMYGLVARAGTTTRVHGVLTGWTKEVKASDDITLWQSTHLMNASGTSVKKAWMEFSAEQRQRGLEPRLVVVHDELESDLGKVTVKDGASSARGHNGLKSIQAAFPGNLKWWRVGVGIGRPQSRDANVVSQYVLRKMTIREEAAIEKAAASVHRVLQDIADGTR
ncbi:peptidyl-tRNA hydrolase-domain-containing protein, partial [Lophiotrema nucula]